MQWGRWLVALLSCVVLLVGCVRTPYQLKKDAQARQVAQLRPAELAHDSGSWRALRSMRIRLYLSAKDNVATQRAEFEQRLERANQVLESSLRLRLVLEDVRQTAAEQLSGSDTDLALRQLEQLDPGEGVDFVVAVIAASPIVTLSFHELGRARVLGKHLVVRTMDDVAELRALEGFDTLDPSERSRLYQQRKRHKETAVLLHELGHTLGALHTRDSLELMHPAHDNEMRSFAPANVELMSLVVQARLAGADPRSDAELFRKLIAAVERSTWQGWIDEERRVYLTELAHALDSGGQPPQSAAAGAVEAPAAAAPPEPDLSALSEPDRERFRTLQQHVQAERWQDAYQLASELAQSYPDSLPVQQKACELGMTLGVSRKTLKPHCDRMMKLSLQGAQ
jgi:hypothetical protein